MKNRIVIEPDSPSAEPFRTLRLAIDPHVAKGTKGLVFTSPRPRDGRSTVAASYAIVSAFVHRPVLLIDADMRNPSIHETFDLPRAPGLVDVLQERLDPWEVTTTFPALGGLRVMTAGSPLPRHGDIAASAPMGRLLQQVYDDCEVVVLDSPPTLIAADAASLASQPDTAVVMVVNHAGTRRHLISALRKLALSDVNVLGLVVNREGA
jgi:protein-tyrosine kinase